MGMTLRRGSTRARTRIRTRACTRSGTRRRGSLHAPDLLLIHVRFEARVEVLPPVKKQRVADELEPRGEFQARVLEHLLQAVGRDVLRGLHLVLAGVEVDVGLDEEDVVN